MWNIRYTTLPSAGFTVMWKKTAREKKKKKKEKPPVIDGFWK